MMPETAGRQNGSVGKLHGTTALDSDLPRIPRISRTISVGHFPPAGNEIALDSDLPRISRAISVGHFPPAGNEIALDSDLPRIPRISRTISVATSPTLETKSPWIRTYHAYHAYHAPFPSPPPATLETKSPWIRTYHAYHAYHAPFPSATSRHVGVKIALGSDLPRIPRISRTISVGHFPPRWSRNRPGFGLITHITRHFRRPLPATLESKSPWVRTYHAYHAYHAPFPSPLPATLEGEIHAKF